MLKLLLISFTNPGIEQVSKRSEDLDMGSIEDLGDVLSAKIIECIL